MAGKVTVKSQKIKETKTETEQLRGEINDLKSMMMQFLQSQGQVKSEDRQVETKMPKNVDEEDFYNAETVQILPSQLINITNLCSGGLTLVGSHNQTIRFERFGQTMPITFEDLNHACSKCRSFAEKGYFYIHNKEAVKLLYLTESYKKIITAKEIENIINLPEKDIKSLVERVSEGIKETVLDIIANGINSDNPAYQNRNKIKYIGDLLGRDLEKRAKSFKTYET